MTLVVEQQIVICIFLKDCFCLHVEYILFVQDNIQNVAMSIKPTTNFYFIEDCGNDTAKVFVVPIHLIQTLKL